jgi:hypothetical protein
MVAPSTIPQFVIPANAGTQSVILKLVPAFAEMPKESVWKHRSLCAHVPGKVCPCAHDRNAMEILDFSGIQQGHRVCLMCPSS